MANDVYITVDDCQSCVRNRRKTSRLRKVCLLPASELLESVDMDILGHLPKTITGNKFIFSMMHRFLKHSKATPTSKTSGTTVGTIFSNN